MAAVSCLCADCASDRSQMPKVVELSTQLERALSQLSQSRSRCAELEVHSKNIESFAELQIVQLTRVLTERGRALELQRGELDAVKARLLAAQSSLAACTCRSSGRAGRLPEPAEQGGVLSRSQLLGVAGPRSLSVDVGAVVPPPALSSSSRTVATVLGRGGSTPSVARGVPPPSPVSLAIATALGWAGQTQREGWGGSDSVGPPTPPISHPIPPEAAAELAFLTSAREALQGPKREPAVAPAAPAAALDVRAEAAQLAALQGKLAALRGLLQGALA
jgi:hypothetical protein